MSMKLIPVLILASLLGIGSVSPTAPAPKTAAALNEVTAVTSPSKNEHNIELKVEDAGVTLNLSGDGTYHFNYDPSKFTVKNSSAKDTRTISVQAKTGVKLGSKDHVTIDIPNISYSSITAVVEDAALKLNAVDANLTVTNDNGAVDLHLPSKFTKTVQYTADDGACSIHLNGNRDLTFKASGEDSAVSLPKGWPIWKIWSDDAPGYSYQSGKGTAKFEIRLNDSALSVKE